MHLTRFTFNINLLADMREGLVGWGTWLAVAVLRQAIDSKIIKFC